MITPTRVDRWYQIEGKGALQAGTANRLVYIRPDTAHVMHYAPDAMVARGIPAVTVHVTGPILRRGDGLQASEKARGRAVFGRFGNPLDRAPDWVRELAATEGVK
jgi:hypothetical protein